LRGGGGILSPSSVGLLNDSRLEYTIASPPVRFSRVRETIAEYEGGLGDVLCVGHRTARCSLFCVMPDECASECE